jgi:hypothetical protein
LFSGPICFEKSFSIFFTLKLFVFASEVQFLQATNGSAF